MFKFFAERKAKLHAREYRRGWDFAAGRILEDGAELAIAILEQNVECSRSFGDHTPFDVGIEAAIAKTQGRSYFSATGTLLNADGSRSIFDDVDR